MDRSKLELDDIFCAAMELALPAERAAYLDQACGADLNARQRVQRLLDAHAQAGSFLGARPAVAPAAASWADQAIGSTIGPFKLLEQIGEGGMGLVFMAEQSRPLRRKVALKVIKPGMDSKQVIARFEAERQALALMDHPNIARVLDGGTTDSGQPFFAMDLVRGIPITEYCDQARRTPRQRLELFQRVCLAVQHAHQRGIIHRDLKPGNVLVTLQDGEPVPKVIDFGIAKATGEQLTDKTLFTCFTQMVGTPLYMSPEQAALSATEVDTRTDVYALGVLLYELLTGTTPFDSEALKKANYDELRRIIREDEPPRPSTRLTTMEQASLSTVCECRKAEPRKLNQQVRGDLDWVVMKALEKDRDRRYESASALAADVQRYLNEDAVEACPPSARYRLRKYVRRNRRLLVPACLIAAVLVGATAVSAWQAVVAKVAQRQAEVAEDRATTEAAIAQAVNDFLQKDLLGQVATDPELRDEPSGNKNLTVKEALDRAAAKIGERFRDQPLLEAAIRTVIGEAYRSVDEYQLEAKHLERALELRQTHLGTGDPNTLDSMYHLATAYSWAGRYLDAIALRQQVLEKRKAMLGPDHPETLQCILNLAIDHRHAGQLDKVVPLLESLIAKQRLIYGPNHKYTLDSMHRLAMAYGDLDRFDESIALHEVALKEIKSTFGAEDESIDWPMLSLAEVCQLAGKLDQADQLLRRLLEQIQRHETSRHWRKRRAGILTLLAVNLLFEHRYTEADPLLREALAIFENEFPDNPKRFICMSNLGAALVGLKKYSDAETYLVQGYEGLRQREFLIWYIHDKRRVIEAGERLIRYYEATNQPENARGWRDRLKSSAALK